MNVLTDLDLSTRPAYLGALDTALRVRSSPCTACGQEHDDLRIYCSTASGTLLVPRLLDVASATATTQLSFGIPRVILGLGLFIIFIASADALRETTAAAMLGLLLLFVASLPACSVQPRRDLHLASFVLPVVLLVIPLLLKEYIRFAVTLVSAIGLQLVLLAYLRRSLSPWILPAILFSCLLFVSYLTGSVSAGALAVSTLLMQALFETLRGSTSPPLRHPILLPSWVERFQTLPLPFLVAQPPGGSIVTAFRRSLQNLAAGFRVSALRGLGDVAVFGFHARASWRFICAALGYWFRRFASSIILALLRLPFTIAPLVRDHVHLLSRPTLLAPLFAGTLVLAARAVVAYIREPSVLQVILLALLAVCSFFCIALHLAFLFRTTLNAGLDAVTSILSIQIPYLLTILLVVYVVAAFAFHTGESRFWSWPPGPATVALTLLVALAFLPDDSTGHGRAHDERPKAVEQESFLSSEPMKPVADETSKLSDHALLVFAAPWVVGTVVAIFLPVGLKLHAPNTTRPARTVDAEEALKSINPPGVPVARDAQGSTGTSAAADRSRLRVLDAAGRGVTVLLDGSPFGIPPIDAAVAPGRHSVRLTRLGCMPREQWVDVPDREVVTIDWQLDCVDRAAALRQASALLSRGEYAAAAARCRATLRYWPGDAETQALLSTIENAMRALLK